MYAVIETGGKQHRVEEGETLDIEKLEVGTGESVDFDKVLMIADGDKVAFMVFDGTDDLLFARCHFLAH